MQIQHRKLLVIVFILSISTFTQAHSVVSDFCMHSFERFAYEGIRDIKESPQLPMYPWQSVDGVLKSLPENYYISHVELARSQNTDIEIWLGAGTESSWPTYVYTPQMIKDSERIWLVYNSQTYETTIIPAKIPGTNLVVYKLFVDNSGGLWGSLIPTDAFSDNKFPVLGVFNETTKQFELIKGMLEIPLDYAFKVQVLSHDGSTLWVFVGDDALYSFNTKSLTNKKWLGLSGMEPSYVSTASDGTLYFSTNLENPSFVGYGSLAQEKLYRFIPETSKLIQVSIPSEWPIYRGLVFDHKDQLWLGSIGFRDRDGKWNLLHTDIDLFFRDPMMGSWLLPTLIFESSDGRLWYTNWWDGGIWYQGSAWYDPSTGKGCMFTNYPTSIIEDQNHELWMVANSILYRYDRYAQ